MPQLVEDIYGQLARSRGVKRRGRHVLFRSHSGSIIQLSQDNPMIAGIIRMSKLLATGANFNIRYVAGYNGYDETTY